MDNRHLLNTNRPTSKRGNVKTITDNGQPEWFDRATCRVEQIPTAVFFSTPADAIAICQRCPTRLNCRELANVNGETQGVWGGQHRSYASGHYKTAELARVVVRRRLPEKSDARRRLARLTIPELLVLAEREGMR